MTTTPTPISIFFVLIPLGQVTELPSGLMRFKTFRIYTAIHFVLHATINKIP